MNSKRFINFIKHALLVVVVLTTLGITGCKEDEVKPTKTIWQLVGEDTDLSSLKTQLEAGGFEATLSGTGTSTDKYTLFAPSNAAMQNLLNTLGLTDFSSIAPDVVKAVLSYHILTSQKLSSELVAGTYATQQGENITVVATTTGEKKFDTGASSDAGLVRKDIKATNGVVHVVDVVLVPPTIGTLILKTLGKVAQPVLLSSSFTTFSKALQKADAGKAVEQTILGALVTLPNVTVFAIPNQVFAGAPTPITVDTYTAAQWDSIIRGHIVTQSLTTLSTGAVTTINGKTLTITAGTPNTVSGLGNTSPVPVVAAGIAAQNGVVYPIGGVLLNP